MLGIERGLSLKYFLQISVGYKILIVIEMNNTVSATWKCMKIKGYFSKIGWSHATNESHKHKPTSGGRKFVWGPTADDEKRTIGGD